MGALVGRFLAVLRMANRRQVEGVPDLPGKVIVVFITRLDVHQLSCSDMSWQESSNQKAILYKLAQL